MSSSAVYVKTLGFFEVSQKGRRVALPRRKERALVAYLTINKDRRFTRDYLADLFWEQSDEERGRHSLNQALYAIRRLLPELLFVEGGVVGCISENVCSDVDQLFGAIVANDMRRALEYFHGEFLTDITLPGCVEFDHWKSNYNRQVISRVDVLARKQLEGLSANAARRLLIQWPAHLVSLLPSVASLDDQGRLPTVVNRQLPEKIQQGSISSESSNQTPLVGREQQLAALRVAFDSTKAGRPQFVVVSGLAGYGKTRLVNEFLRELSTENVNCFTARCYESERKIAFGSISDILAATLKHVHEAELDGIWFAAIAQFFPALHLDSTSPPELSARAAQDRLFEAVRILLSHVSDTTPVVWFLDDAQWADNSTRAVMAYLNHHMQKGKVLVIAAHRKKSYNGRVVLPWGEWQEVEVDELSTESVTSLIGALNRDLNSTNVDQVRRLAGGHPYLLTEIIRCIIRGDLSAVEKWHQPVVLKNVDSFVGGLLRSIPNPAQRLVAALAILARPVSVTLLSAVARLKRFHSFLDLIISRDLATNVGGRISLRHDLIREVAYRQIPLFTRTELHKRAGDVLGQSQRRAGEAAEHYYKAQHRTLAYKFAIRAFKNADRRNASDEGISYLRLAISCTPRNVALRFRLAEKLHRAHRFSEAWNEVCYLLSRPAIPRDKKLPLRLIYLELAYNFGKMSQEALGDLIAEIKSEPQANALLSRALRLKVRSIYSSANRDAISDCIRELQDFIGRSETSDSVEALALVARLKSLIESSIEAERWMLPVLTAIGAVKDEELKIRISGLIATVAYEVGKLSKAEETHRQILRQIDSIGAITSWPMAASHTHMLLVEQGKYSDAIELEQSIRTRAKPADAVHVYAVLATNTASMYYEMGDFAKARDAITEAVGHISTVEATFLKLELWGLKGLVALEYGEVAEATQCANDGKALLQAVGFRAADVSFLEILIARIATIANHRDAAVARLREAIEDYKERDVVCRLRMQLELANLLKKSGHTDNARIEAKGVFHTATAINARPIAEKADSLLHRM